jgi:SAM-dependent methyltransferase
MNKYCDICNEGNYHEFYNGDIRDGSFGGIKHSAIVYECSNCGVQKLKEEDCIPEEFYESGEYREKLEQSLKSTEAIVEQDEMQHYTLNTLFPYSLRESSVLDVGCGVGSLLDRLQNISSNQVGIEPCKPYLESLKERGYNVFPSLEDAKKEYSNSIDYAFSIQVIEHVKNPKEFLKEIKNLMKPDGKILISTPNRNDILMTLLKDKFYPFFYRTQHRWYFDQKSLTICSELAGLKVNKISFVHRYGMANTLYWLRDMKPKGSQKINGIESMADSLWKVYLENTQQSDNLYIELSL